MSAVDVRPGYDVAVIGLGAMGSAAAYHLARRGLRVLGIDRFAPPHRMGSTLGGTRIIREAYYEHPLYVPLVRRALELWRELERDAGHRSLLVRNGGLMIGPADGTFIRGVLTSAHEHDVPHEPLPIARLRARFPRYAAPEDWTAIYEPGAGFLRPEAIVECHLALARRHAAELVVNDAAARWQPDGEGYRVTTGQGTFTAGRLVLAAGAWTGELTRELALPLRVERQVSHWFRPAAGAAFGPEEMPVTMWQLGDGRIFYTTPDVGDGVKAGFHHGGEITTASEVRRTVLPDEIAEARATLGGFVPLAAGEPAGSAVCLYTDTPDEHFLIDRHPHQHGVVIVSACSGHGFKFASAIGEMVADLVQDHAPRFDLRPFALARFGAA